MFTAILYWQAQITTFFALFSAEGAYGIPLEVWRTINLFIFLIVMFLLVRKPFAQAMLDRRTSIQSELKRAKAEKEESEKFTVTSPLRMDTSFTKEYVTQIRSVRDIEIRTQEKGYLENIYVDEGQFVKKGTLMFKIMPLVYQAEAQTAQAEANYAEIEYMNTKALADSNIVSKNELALAKARLDKAKAELTLAQTHLGFTEIRAPFDGIMDHFLYDSEVY